MAHLPNMDECIAHRRYIIDALSTSSQSELEFHSNKHLWFFSWISLYEYTFAGKRKVAASCIEFEYNLKKKNIFKQTVVHNLHSAFGKAARCPSMIEIGR